VESPSFGTVVTLDKGADGLDDQDERDSGHDEAEGDVAGSFNAGFAAWEAARVDTPDGAVAEDEGEVAVEELALISFVKYSHNTPARIKDSISHRSKE